ncbi:MAG: hypothetical protein KDB06_12110 [Ilumatobacter sp.]|nr:hypothetical protein [Ilumatobacter sp.]MCB0985384.1 hypothetical protein [Ilumatobacter sp.]
MSVTRTVPRRGAAAAVALAALALAACGGDDSPSSEGTTASTASPTTAAGSDTTAAAPSDLPEGDVVFRAVNLLDEPVDLYVRTTGLVQAELVQAGLAPGEVSDTIAPPPDGALAVLEAGASDPECVATCPHIIATLSAGADYGPTHTVLLQQADGQRSAVDLWEDPTPLGEGNSNAMPAADPTTALVVVSAGAVTNDDFGMRVSYDGVTGCQDSNLQGILVGGTSTPAYAVGADTEILFHDNTDQDCADTPVGGPFAVGGAAGSRSHLILWGEPGALEGMVLPFLGTAGDDGGSATGEPPTGTATRDDVVAFITAELAREFGFTEEQSACVAEYFVDGVGLDTLIVNGEIVDLDTLSDDVVDAATDALLAAIDPCGIDPSVLGA